MTPDHILLIDRSGFRKLPPGSKALYEISFPNGKRYLGMTNDVKRRRQRHKAQAVNNSEYPVHRAMRRYGFPAATLRVLAVGPSPYISDLEAMAVEAFRTRDPAFGYNIMPGGLCNPMEVPEIAKAVGLKLRGRKNPEEIRLKKQVCWTPERRAAESRRHKGKVITPEHRQKLRDAAKRRRELNPPKPKIRKKRSSGRSHREAALARWTPSDRMAEDLARDFWMDGSITMKSALSQMQGWARRSAYRVFGRRYTQPPRILETILADAKGLFEQGICPHAVACITGISTTHIKRLSKKWGYA